MNEYLSHRSAAEYHNIPALEAVLPGAEGVPARGVTDVSFPKHAGRFRVRGTRVHASALALPRGAVVARRDGGGLVASPELVFLQMAQALDIQRLILLGLQMCAHEPGHQETAITTKKRLAAFVAKSKGHRGYRKAMRAAKYVEDGSWSIMESLAFMVLTLPHALGGYGLSGAAFNHEVALDRRSGSRLSQDRCFVDLYFEKARLAVEYQSHQHHATAAAQGRDMERAGILERLGVRVMMLSTIQLYREDACRDFAFNLAARLGRRIRIRTKQFAPMHASLRALFPQKPIAAAPLLVEEHRHPSVL
jgi:hypothetical protein